MMIQLKGQASANMSTVMTVQAVSFSYFTIKALCIFGSCWQRDKNDSAVHSCGAELSG